ncbi:hypothetical protein BGY98DRAFT_1049398 [Russula aff. rugulosa BPL654]|nr:hypothetical protein BGY98DRAFT_1049398 [Russula aff. rugulosa BPL654]
MDFLLLLPLFMTVSLVWRNSVTFTCCLFVWSNSVFLFLVCCLFIEQLCLFCFLFVVFV